MSRDRSRYLFAFSLLIILTLATFVRFSGLDAQGRHMDEYGQTKVYTLPLRYVVMAAQRQVCQPQLDYVIGWALARIEQSDWMRRFPAAFFGVLGVAACALLGRRLVSPGVGLAAAVMLAVSPLHWSLSRIARPYTICVFALLLMLWTLARAVDSPTRRRMVAYAAAAYFMTLTRSLLPLVVLLATGATLTALLLARRFRPPVEGEETRDAAHRALLVTVLVALAAIPMPSALLPGHEVPFTLFGTLASVCKADFGIFAPPVAPFPPTLAANAAVWLGAGKVMFGGLFPAIAALASVGAVLTLRGRQGLSAGARCVLTVMAAAGPLYLVVFSAMAPRAKMMVAYGVFIVPVVAIFAATALVFTADKVSGWGSSGAWHAPRLRGHALLAKAKRSAAMFDTPRKNMPAPPAWAWHPARLVAGPLKLNAGVSAALTAAFVLLLATPAVRLVRAGYDPLYGRPDWRGCAAYLADKVTSQDVIITFEDRPLEPGWSQPSFWGKHDWPIGMDKPLAESAWTLVSSEPHFRRLLAQTGRCFVVVKDFDGEIRSDGADPSFDADMALTRFRGLKLLIRRHPAENPSARMIEACDDLLAMPKEYPEADAFLYVLRSRLQLRAGDVAAAVESFDLARAIVDRNPGLSEWFARAAHPHVDQLASAIDGMERSG